MYFLGLAVQVPGFRLPVLSFALVRCEFQRSAAAHVKGLVDVEDCLHPVVSCGKVVQTFGWIAQRRYIDDGRIPRSQRIDVDAKDLLRLGSHEADLEARLDADV